MRRAESRGSKRAHSDHDDGEPAPKRRRCAAEVEEYDEDLITGVTLYCSFVFDLQLCTHAESDYEDLVYQMEKEKETRSLKSRGGSRKKRLGGLRAKCMENEY